MALSILGLPPDRNGYKAKRGNSAISTQLAGGAPRVRRDQLGVVSTVEVQWTCDPGQFDYLNAFFRTGAQEGSAPFQIELVGIDSSTPTTYTAWFVPDTFQLSDQSGLTYVVSAQLWVLPSLPDVADDQQLMSQYG